jgi:hypothetical protein
LALLAAFGAAVLRTAVFLRAFVVLEEDLRFKGLRFAVLEDFARFDIVLSPVVAGAPTPSQSKTRRRPAGSFISRRGDYWHIARLMKVTVVHSLSDCLPLR